MKLPSLKILQDATKAVLWRFPLEIFCASIGTALLLWRVEQNDLNDSITRLILCSVLGLVLFLSQTIMAESYGFSKLKRSIAQVVVVIVLIISWFTISPIEAETSIIRFGFLAVAFHLLVSFAPKTSIDGFWEYNKQLFLRILTAQLYSWVLFIGICVAVGSADFLFSLDLDSKIYLRLFILIVGLFNTIFFLAGVPHNYQNLQQQYPKGLKVFTQYVLIPLASIYLTIILFYEAKVLLAWSLPMGIISWLILGYAVYGILSILLVHPVQLAAGNTWIKKYSQWFYVLLLPLLPLLFTAIIVRIQNYGLTEFRYIVLVLATWLSLITIYFLFVKQQNIKLIPVSLAIVALMSAWGPQSASAVSEESQRNRLIRIFESQGSWQKGKLQRMPEQITDSIGNEAVEQLRFVIERYGAKSLHEVLSDEMNASVGIKDSIKNRYSKRYAEHEILRKELGLKPFYAANSALPSRYYQVRALNDDVPLDGYTTLRTISWKSYQTDDKTIKIKGDTLTVMIDGESRVFDIAKIFNVVENSVDSEGQKYPNTMSGALMSTSAINATEPVSLWVRFLDFEKKGDQRRLSEIEAIILR